MDFLLIYWKYSASMLGKTRRFSPGFRLWPNLARERKTREAIFHSGDEATRKAPCRDLGARFRQLASYPRETSRASSSSNRMRSGGKLAKARFRASMGRSSTDPATCAVSV